MTDQADPLEQGRAFGDVIDVLEAIGAAYAIWGGLAVVAHGEPPFTMDMDVLLSQRSFALDLFVRRLQDTHYYVDRIAVQRAITEGGYFSVIHLYTHIKTDFYVPRSQGSSERLLQQALEERLHLPFDEARQAAYLFAEDTITSKLNAFAASQSTRHLDDVRSIIRVRGDKGAAAARPGAPGVWRSLWDEEASELQ